MKALLVLLNIFLASIVLAKTVDVRKNVVIIMADDLGYNDVSFRGSSEIPTYNIDALAYGGISLNNFRTPPMCTPSRSALMTGKYPHHLGMQHFVIPSDEPWGLSPNEKIMPQYFKDAGYVTKMIGKWHLGFHQEQYLPNNRGIDEFFGYLGPYIDYWDYTLEMFDRNFSRGYDLRENYQTVRSPTKKYATELLTEEAVKAIKVHDKNKPLFMIVNQLAAHAGNENDPMQAKQEDIDKFPYITDIKRRTLAAMIYQLDKSVGEIVKALKDVNILDNTVVVFYSDNGGPTTGFHSTSASNYPLRGQKTSAWEGAIRTNGIIYSNDLPKSVTRKGMFYVGDWLPTLKTLTNANFKIKEKIDGIDQTAMLKSNVNRRIELVTIDDVAGYGAYIFQGYKLLNGSSSAGANDKWLGTNNNVNILDNKNYFDNLMQSEVAKALKLSVTAKKVESLRKLSTIFCTKQKCNENTCDLMKGPCLFNLNDDPCEEVNLAENRQVLLQTLMKMYKDSLVKMVPSRRRPFDPNCDPKNFDLVWSPWQKNSFP